MEEIKLTLADITISRTLMDVESELSDEARQMLADKMAAIHEELLKSLFPKPSAPLGTFTWPPKRKAAPFRPWGVNLNMV